MEDLVSVITPSYNSEKYIAKTIESVQAQKYTNWEMLIVDDNSTDGTCDIVRKYAEKDSRIKLFCQKDNLGAGPARNEALSHANGRFIAYLDADDLWLPDKLMMQTDFMKNNECYFSCTAYEVIDDDGKKLNKIVKMLESVSYKKFLTNNLLQTVGIMVDTATVDKKLLTMPDIRRRQDAATWLQILKAGFDCKGINTVLAMYRRTKNSLSSNKKKAAKGVWYLYREVEHLSLPYSCYCFVRYAVLAVWKRIYF